MSVRVRIAATALALSAGGLIALLAPEGFTPEAVIPTKGDVPTVGFGSTRHEDGSPVRLGDKVDPVRALIKAQAHIARDEKPFRASLEGARLHQEEYDVYLDFTYQFGLENWLGSSMRRLVFEERYEEACRALLKYKYAAGFDCSTPGNKRCSGVWTRQQERVQRCLSVQ